MILLANPDWGSVPEWVGAIGTVLAFTLALSLGLWELRQRRVEQRDEQVKQARLFILNEPTIEGGSIFVRARNHSNELVYDAQVGIRYWQTEHGEGKYQFSDTDVIDPNSYFDFEIHMPPVVAEFESPRVWFVDASGRRWLRTSLEASVERVHSSAPVDLVMQVLDSELDYIKNPITRLLHRRRARTVRKKLRL